MTLNAVIMPIKAILLVRVFFLEKIFTTILYIVYNKSRCGLCDMFKTDELVENYIHNNISEAYSVAVKKASSKKYVLNIASTEDYGDFKDDIPDKSILEYQLSI